MKLADLFEDATVKDNTLKLSTDNPGGSWLENKRKASIEDGVNEFGTPKFGSVTGYWNRKVLLPVSVISKFKGMRGEHTARYTRQDSLDWLTKDMSEKNHLPFMGSDTNRQYAPFIMVYQDGTPYFNEGNHRVKVAVKLGWKYIPIELRYFNGGELEDGPLSPDKVKKYDAEAHAAGYETGEGFRGKLDK